MRLRPAYLITFLMCCGAIAHATPEQKASCRDVHLLARIARTQSPQVLSQLGALAGDTYLAKLVFAFRMFELEPSSDSGAGVIGLIPRNQDQERLWHSLNGLLCDQESLADVKSLGSLQDRLPHVLAKAIDANPDRMYEFVSYAYDSIQDPQSDYAVQMQMVCRHHHGRFVDAVNQMPEKDRTWFVTKIFDPAGCRAIALPEAD
jgi:hypothetical protein